MADLTPEERQRIYLEEKARLEVRHELEGKKTSVGKVIGILVLCGFALLVVMFIIGSVVPQSEEDAFKKLTPEQRHQKTLENCASLMRTWAFKLDSELSVTERQMKVSCTEQLLHPDQEIIRPPQ